MSASAIAVERDMVQRDLWARTATAAGRLNRAHAELVDIAAALIEGGHWGDGGFRSPEHYLTVRAGLSPAHARDVVVVARRRTELPDEQPPCAPASCPSMLQPSWHTTCQPPTRVSMTDLAGTPRCPS